MSETDNPIPILDAKSVLEFTLFMVRVKSTGVEKLSTIPGGNAARAYFGNPDEPIEGNASALLDIYTSRIVDISWAFQFTEGGISVQAEGPGHMPPAFVWGLLRLAAPI